MSPILHVNINPTGTSQPFSDGVQITSDSWCGAGKKFPRLCDPEGSSCFLCSSDVPGYEIGEVLRPSRKFWASAIQNSQQNSRTSVEINFNAAYQLSGVYLQLGPGILPKTLSIGKLNIEN